MMQTAGTEFLRRRNRARILSVLRKHGQVAHTDLHIHSGLSSASVSKITGELESEGIIERNEETSSKGRGRPRVLFRHKGDAAHIVDVRVVLDKIVFSLVDYAGTLKDRFEVKRVFQKPDIEAFGQDLRAGLDRLCERNELTRQAIKTVSITSKGVVEKDRPVLLWSPVFDHNRIDFRDILDPSWKVHVTVTNETQYSSQAAVALRDRLIASQDSTRLAVLSLGHGVGLGMAELKEDGTVHSYAPNFGHMIHEPGGPLCRCGSRGCIEAYAGFYGILRTAFEVPADTIPSRFVPLVEVEGVAANARYGDRRAQHAFNKAGEAIGVGLSRLISMYEPMPIIVTGQGVGLFDLMESELRYHLAEGLSVRVGKMPEISIIEDEVNLIHEGNKNTSLRDLDVLFAENT